VPVALCGHVRRPLAVIVDRVPTAGFVGGIPFLVAVTAAEFIVAILTATPRIVIAVATSAVWGIGSLTTISLAARLVDIGVTVAAAPWSGTVEQVPPPGRFGAVRSVGAVHDSPPAVVRRRQQGTVRRCRAPTWYPTVSSETQ